jgi:hypothetical protein
MMIEEKTGDEQNGNRDGRFRRDRPGRRGKARQLTTPLL